MIKHADDLYKWDFKDRLLEPQQRKPAANYVYDYSGQRVVKKSQKSGEHKLSYFLNKGFESETVSQ